jgi:hypothetical protein
VTTWRIQVRTSGSDRRSIVLHTTLFYPLVFFRLIYYLIWCTQLSVYLCLYLYPFTGRSIPLQLCSRRSDGRTGS